MAKSATFSLRAYGEKPSEVMCRYWCKRMTFLMMHDDETQSSFHIATETLALFDEPAEFSELADGAVDPLASRVAVLRALRF